MSTIDYLSAVAHALGFVVAWTVASIVVVAFLGGVLWLGCKLWDEGDTK